MPPPTTQKSKEEPQPNEEARTKSESRKARKRSSDREAQESREQARKPFWNQGYTGMKSRNDWTPTRDAEVTPTHTPTEAIPSENIRKMNLDEQLTPNPEGISPPVNDGLTERFEEALQEDEMLEEIAPPQEAASSSGGASPKTPDPQEPP